MSIETFKEIAKLKEEEASLKRLFDEKWKLQKEQQLTIIRVMRPKIVGNFLVNNY